MKNTKTLLATLVLGVTTLITTGAQATPFYHYCESNIGPHRIQWQYNANGIKLKHGKFMKNLQKCDIRNDKVLDYKNGKYTFELDVQDPLTHVWWKDVVVTVE